MYRTRWEHRALCRGVHKITDLEKCPIRISKDEAPTSQEDTVKNLLELTKPLTELNASLNLMVKEIHGSTYRPCWITKIKFLPNIYLRGKKRREGPHQQGGPQTGWPGLHQVQGRQPSLCTKGDTSHEECDGQSTNGCQIFQHKRAAETEHRPQCSQRSRGSKKQRSTGGNQLSEPPTPLHTKRWKRKQQERKKHGGRLPQILMGPHTSFYLFIF